MNHFSHSPCCQQTTLDLPSWLNGSIAPARAITLETHLESCIHCQEELQQTLLAIQVLDSHLPSQILSQYALICFHEFEASKVDSSNVDSQIDDYPISDIEKHLESCVHCRGDLELIHASESRVVAGGDSDTSFGRERATPFSAPQSRALSSLPVWLRVAAVILVAVGAGTWLLPTIDSHSTNSKSGQAELASSVDLSSNPTEPQQAKNEFAEKPVRATDLISENQFEDGSFGTWLSVSVEEVARIEETGSPEKPRQSTSIMKSTSILRSDQAWSARHVPVPRQPNSLLPTTATVPSG